jgi:Oxidoreductase family, NAD-binding Rossmann fold
VKVCLAGHGAFGIKHLEAMAKIPGIEVISLAGSNLESAREVAQQWKIPHWTASLAESLAQPGLDAVILTTPTQMHAAQGEQCMRAGKHVMIEIPMADSVADSERLVRIQKETGVVAMAGHTRRFNPSHQWVHKHQRTRQAPQLDRSSAVAPCLPHRGFVRLSDRRKPVARIRLARTDTSGFGHCHGYEHRPESRFGRDLHFVVIF